MHGNNRRPAPPQLQLLFQTQPHPEQPGMTALIFSFGPMQQVVVWPTAELGKLITSIEEAQGETKRVIVPELGGILGGKG